QFPLDVLKIDRSFIANIDRGRDFAALVQAVVQLARNLSISVVAEGIETVDQLLTLQALDCEFGQGYLFSRPLMADQMVEFRIPPCVLPGQAA
ncbi:MAG: EAL domain-containing protein, partial [Tepidisphaeraceae bacterium]